MTAPLENGKLKKIIKHWKCIAAEIHEPLNEKDYKKLSSTLDKLLDITGGDESHELIGLIDVISHMLSMYDERSKQAIKHVNGIDVLRFLMQQHHLNQSDMKNEIGSQGVVSEILQGKRKLNINQIKKLAKRFHVSPNTFID